MELVLASLVSELIQSLKTANKKQRSPRSCFLPPLSEMNDPVFQALRRILSVFIVNCICPVLELYTDVATVANSNTHIELTED